MSKEAFKPSEIGQYFLEGTVRHLPEYRLVNDYKVARWLGNSGFQDSPKAILEVDSQNVFFKQAANELVITHNIWMYRALSKRTALVPEFMQIYELEDLSVQGLAMPDLTNSGENIVAATGDTNTDGSYIVDSDETQSLVQQIPENKRKQLRGQLLEIFQAATGINSESDFEAYKDLVPYELAREVGVDRTQEFWPMKIYTTGLFMLQVNKDNPSESRILAVDFCGNAEGSYTFPTEAIFTSLDMCVQYYERVFKEDFKVGEGHSLCFLLDKLKNRKKVETGRLKRD